MLLKPLLPGSKPIVADTVYGESLMSYGIGGALGLHRLEQTAGADRLMLAAMHLTPIGTLADVEPALERLGERSDAETDAAAPAWRTVQPLGAFSRHPRSADYTISMVGFDSRQGQAIRCPI